MGILVIALSINPRPLSALELTLSGLIMGSRVDTAGDNQNPHVIISNYIGQTGDKLRNRKTVHEQQIRDPSTRQMPVSAHIDNCCKTEPKFSIFPFYKFQNDDVSARLSKERYFIDVFSPNLNTF